jgi:hypothetical protein
MSKTTHWSVTDNPEDWHDDPATSPIEAVKEWLTGESAQDEAWDDRNEIMDGETVTITVHGWHETNEPLDDQHSFDGYEPGQTYFAPTKDTVKVRVCLAYEVQP